MDATESSKLSDGINAPMWMFWRRRRYVLVFLAFFGFFNVYSLRVNLSVAIVAMTENRTVQYPNGTIGYEQEFDWDSTTKGYILSSFFYGYIFTQLIGGYISNALGGNYVFGVGVGVTAGLTLLTPLAAHAGFGWLIAVRATEGFFEGVTFPCIHAIWSNWAPPSERSRMATIAFSGVFTGTVASMLLSGVLADTLGWEWVFYILGAFGCLWFVAWMLIVKKSPESDPYITTKEKEFILATLQRSAAGGEKVQHPWRGILTSKAVWALIVSSFSENWGFYTLLTQLPTFLRDTMHFELQAAGFLSALPYLVMGLLLSVAGYLADLCQIRRWLTTTQVRRYFNCGAFLAQTVFMLVGAYILRPAPTLTCITIAVGCGAFAWCGFAVNHLDLSPKSAGVLMGISNTFSTVAGILTPIVSGQLTASGSENEWRTVFYIAAGIYLIGCVTYWFGVSGELQPWSIEAREREREKQRQDGGQGYANEGLVMEQKA
ncbi:sialin-like [Anopheles merus]|uniref:Sialin n=2 Tax=gambiae species complex TaxID=44542 RepID=A0A6E8VQ18_ANOCL|nr:sialin-like [Anopheles coluzzii]XP_040227454.2 sialin-like [Anopheles coluzzii]XP_041771884.1 sialin-like [Anopheles merus]XP_041771885.1 sialin-like [Anopheles merus]XP_316622.5 sialin [Anopheles gambiae]